MIIIGLINVILGLSSYHSPKDPARMNIGLGDPDLLPVSMVPTVVVRSFVARYPHTIAAGAKHEGRLWILTFPATSPHHHATFGDDGSFVSED